MSFAAQQKLLTGMTTKLSATHAWGLKMNRNLGTSKSCNGAIFASLVMVSVAVRSATEALDGDDKFFCDACKGLQDAQKRMKIKVLPHVLCLHLKRFKYIEQQDRCCHDSYA